MTNLICSHWRSDKTFPIFALQWASDGCHCPTMQCTERMSYRSGKQKITTLEKTFSCVFDKRNWHSLTPISVSFPGVTPQRRVMTYGAPTAKKTVYSKDELLVDILYSQQVAVVVTAAAPVRAAEPPSTHLICHGFDTGCSSRRNPGSREGSWGSNPRPRDWQPNCSKTPEPFSTVGIFVQDWETAQASLPLLLALLVSLSASYSLSSGEMLNTFC